MRLGPQRSLPIASIKAMRNPNNLPTKVCVVCERPFTWRKKWERDWDEVTTCSKRCNAERKKQARSISRLGLDSEQAVAERDTVDEAKDAVDEAKRAKREAKKAAKAERRAIRAGMADASIGQKECSLCSRSVDLLIRCQVDATKQWKLVCGRCWKLPQVAGGVVDGSGENPNYRYGGLWKNLRAN